MSEGRWTWRNSALALFMLCMVGVLPVPVTAQEDPPTLSELLAQVEAATPKGAPPALDAEKLKFPFGHFYKTIEVEKQEKIDKTFTGPSTNDTFELPSFEVTGKIKRGRKSRIFIGRTSLKLGESYQGAKLIRLDFRNGEATFRFKGTTFKKDIP